MKPPDPELAAYLAKRDALFRDMTLEHALKLFAESPNRNVRLARPDVPLAAAHKARLQWLDATDAMLAESVQWLMDHGYQTTQHGAPPLTPERRDADRAALGKPPLSRRQP
jgi:hypothetical protein